MAMSIGKLARATATAVETVRYYEKIGLLPEPPRTSGNYRDYGSADVDRVTFVRSARDLGFSIEQVRALLSLADEGDRDCGDVDQLAKGHLLEVDRKIAGLTALRRELATLIEQCQSGTVAECRILKALARPQ